VTAGTLLSAWDAPRPSKRLHLRFLVAPKVKKVTSSVLRYCWEPIPPGAYHRVPRESWMNEAIVADERVKPISQ
jgi:hypothetical protein